jgi:flagellar assembly factor FliW
VIIKTGRFGSLEISETEIIRMPFGLLGFPEQTKFCLVDPGDETLILWLQSLDNPNLAIPILEPKIFKTDYTVRLSAAELRELKLDNVNQSAVFTILTIGEDVAQMSANIRAPIVINLKERVAKQVVLQENEYSLRHPMFKELRTHLMTISAQKKSSTQVVENPIFGAVRIEHIPPSLTVRPLHSA